MCPTWAPTLAVGAQRPAVLGGHIGSIAYFEFWILETLWWWWVWGGGGFEAGGRLMYCNERGDCSSSARQSRLARFFLVRKDGDMPTG